MEETISFKVVFKTSIYEFTLPSTTRISSLKHEITQKSQIPFETQKLLFKGTLKDDATLKESKITHNSKVMLMASSITDIIKLNSVVQDKSQFNLVTVHEKWVDQISHQKILKLSKPGQEDCFIGHKFVIPERGLQNLLNHQGVKTRLTFKRLEKELWLSTPDRTQKLPFAGIRDVVSQKQNEDGFFIVALKLGETEKSYYWLYWVPCQFVDAIKEEILGKFI